MVASVDGLSIVVQNTENKNRVRDLQLALVLPRSSIPRTS